MSAFKIITTVSLGLMISFGASGCSGTTGGNETSQTQGVQTPAPDESPAKPKTETVRLHAEKSFNELHLFAQSEEMRAFYDEMSAVEGDGPEAIATMESILDKHKSVQDTLKEKIGLTPEAVRGYQGIFAMSNASMDTPYSEKLMDSLVYFVALGDIVGAQNEGMKDNTFGITSNAVSEESGKFKLNSYGVYVKDENNAITEFPEFSFTSYGLDNEGKKIVIEEVTGESRDDQKNTSNDIKPAADYDATAFNEYVASYSSADHKDLVQYVEYLNSAEYPGDAEFEIVEKNGVDYVKVTDPNTKIVEEEVLYASPIK